jgi:hypothetical protein
MNCFAGALKPIGLCCFPAIPHASQSRVPPACATYFPDLTDSADQDAAAARRMKRAPGPILQPGVAMYTHFISGHRC